MHAIIASHFRQKEALDPRDSHPQCELPKLAPTPQHCAPTTTPLTLVPPTGKGSHPRPPSPALRGPPSAPSIRHPRFLDSAAPEVPFPRRPYLHDDARTAAPSTTPDSPAPGGETKDTVTAAGTPCSGTRCAGRGGERPPGRERPTRGLAWPRHRTPRRPPGSAAQRPHCRDPTEFPSSDNDAISVKEETRNQPGRPGPLRSALPASEGPTRRAAAHVPSRDRGPTDRTSGPRGPAAGTGDGRRGRRRLSLRARRAPPRPSPTPGRGHQAGATAGGRGEAGAPQAEAKDSGARRAHRGDPPARWPGPGTPRRTPRRARGRLRNALPSSEAGAEPSASGVPSPAPPQNQQARGRDGETRGASSGAEAEAPAPPPPAAATGTFVWRPLGFPRWGEGDDEKPSRTGARAPVALPPRGRRPQTLLRLAPGRGPGGGRGGGQLSFRDSSAPAPKLLTPDSTDGQTSLPPPEPPLSLRSPLP